MAGGTHPPPEVIASWPTPNYVDPTTKGYGLVILCSVLGFFSIATVSLRLWTRASITKNFGADDWVILLAMFPTLGMAIAIGLASKMYYFDRHVWDVPIPDGVVETRKITFVIELLYVWSVGLIKISILLFYKRLSSEVLRTYFIYVIWGTIAFVAAYMITFSLTLFAACQPFEAYWYQVDPFWLATHDYQCIDDPANLLAASIISVIQDFLVAGLPTLMFARMDIPFRQKLAMAAVFAVGFFLCITGCLRIVYIHEIFYSTYDVTWRAGEAWYWTAVEGLLATVVASVPALKVFIQRHLGSIIRSYTYGATDASPKPMSRGAGRFSMRGSRRMSGGRGWARAQSEDGNDVENSRRAARGPAVPLERVTERPSKESHSPNSPVDQARKITEADLYEEDMHVQDPGPHNQGQHQKVASTRQQALKSHPTGKIPPRRSSPPKHPPPSTPLPPISPTSPRSHADFEPLPNSPDRKGHGTWMSDRTSECSEASTASTYYGHRPDNPTFDPDIQALPTLTEQETRAMGLKKPS